ncbi:uracil phosphoribosyltransferase-domain-containing protein [Stachybotrys elegans]|uniref:Uracil phosphoribosyltransferase-domain-containing protein n=1 Tax=Stachybotrys elegans TaxID=80388 RepID=A0A8K0SEA7_9HYPO|nr:uracil phosphoribosyltransferase-domain-containing protein [Stachybotrys elegans]
MAPKPTVIGLYGISGCGKSTLLSQLKDELSQAAFTLYEGSEKLASIVPGGLQGFFELDADRKAAVRAQAIQQIRQESASTGNAAIVTGHYMFWDENSASGQKVCTQSDLETFTHIIYLNTPNHIIFQRRQKDRSRRRTAMSPEHLRLWQETEIASLRELCHQHQILFSIVSGETILPRVISLIRHFVQPATAESNLEHALRRLNEILALPHNAELETMLVLDGDKTLAAIDTGAMFWEALGRDQPSQKEKCPLHELFSSPLGYSEAAFRQATLLYEDATDSERFETTCDDVASTVVIHSELLCLLQHVAKHKHVGAVVVTCGLGLVWEKTLGKYGLSETVQVIGGGRLLDGFVVTGAVKASIASHLRHTAKLYVWAFGDSPLDLPMLKEAHRAIVIVGDEATRSQSMDQALVDAISTEGFLAQQLLLPGDSRPRLDANRLPLVCLNNLDFVDSIMRQRQPPKILHATMKHAAKLLASSTRDSSVAGPALREAHEAVGRYLATEYVSQIIGLEEYSVSHVQGHHTTAHRLRCEQRTTIVALMRGGEPMAFGINAVFPKAMFVHATTPMDIKTHHVYPDGNVILVDSVVNSGKTLMEFVMRVRQLDPHVGIFAVTGVVQAEAMEAYQLTTIMADCKASLVALRVSHNKFTGTKGTDTGNRLFNTTHLI